MNRNTGSEHPNNRGTQTPTQTYNNEPTTNFSSLINSNNSTQMTMQSQERISSIISIDIEPPLARSKNNPSKIVWYIITISSPVIASLFCINKEIKVKLSPNDNRPAYSQSLRTPINLLDDITVELALLHRYGIITTLPFSKFASPIFLRENQTDVFAFWWICAKSKISSHRTT